MEAIKRILSAAQAESKEFKQDFATLEEVENKYQILAHEYATRCKRMEREIFFTKEECGAVTTEVKQYIYAIYDCTRTKLYYKLRNNYKL